MNKRSGNRKPTRPDRAALRGNGTQDKTPKPKKYVRPHTPPNVLLKQCATKFCQLLERIDTRLLAADGPVPQVCALTVATPTEIRWLYLLADKFRKTYVEAPP